MIHVGGYHEYRGGCSVPWGTQITKDFSPYGTEHPLIRVVSEDILNISKDIVSFKAKFTTGLHKILHRGH